MLLCQNLTNGPATSKLQTLSKLKKNGWLTPLIPYWNGSILSKLKSQYKIDHPPVLPLNYVKKTLPAPASEHTNESRKLNSASAMPSNVQHDTSAAQGDYNEMDINIITAKRTIHEVQNPLRHPNQPIKVDQRVIKIHPTKSWLTTTSSSGTVEVMGVIEKT